MYIFSVSNINSRNDNILVGTDFRIFLNWIFGLKLKPKYILDLWITYCGAFRIVDLCVKNKTGRTYQQKQGKLISVLMHK